MSAMSAEEIASAVKAMADDARAWNDDRSTDRTEAIDYYNGVMTDTPSDDGRSRVVSRDFRAATKKILPVIIRTILGNDRIVEFEPVGESDEAGSEQATEYVNRVVVPECNARAHIHDAIHDAVVVRNGILKAWWETKTDIRVSRYSGLDPAELAAVAGSDDAEIIEQTPSEDGTVSAKIKHRFTDGKLRIACIPNEDFMISPDALSVEDAVFVAHRQKLRRYELIAMGYDRDQVMAMSAWTETAADDEDDARRDKDADAIGRHNEKRRELDEIEYWECYVRLDADDDGIAELRRIVMAGGWKPGDILEDDECDFAPFADIVIERKAHEWLGRSLFDDVKEIQRVKTVLLRATLDNLYWQNNQQPIVQRDAVENIDAVANPQFGKPIFLRAGYSAQDAIGTNVVPFMAEKSFQMLGYMDDMLTDRTGISDASGGLPPDALQNVTAKASALMEQQGISQVELMVRNVADGLRRLFRIVLRTIKQNPDKERVMRLRDNWVPVDPNGWNADMDASVNIGLGAGSRERDMVMMQIVNGMQEKLIAAFGPDNPYVTPENLYNSISKLYEAAGLNTVGLYITKPQKGEVEAKLAEKASQPSPEQMKLQADMALEDKKIEATAVKEREQRDADLIVKQAELEARIRELTIQTQATSALELEKQARQHAHERVMEMLKANTAAVQARNNPPQQPMAAANG